MGLIFFETSYEENIPDLRDKETDRLIPGNFEILSVDILRTN